jgi:TIR domain
VKNHLVPRLDARLNEVAQDLIRISCDYEMESGVRWPDEIKRRLRRSALLVTVWSADYFRSSWCMAEWFSFRRREEMLGLFSADQTRGLVYPIRYADGDYYHHDAQLTQCRKDFSRLNYPDDVFLVQGMAQELVHQLGSLPQWRDDFPIVEPDPLQPVKLSRPTI